MGGVLFQSELQAGEEAGPPQSPGSSVSQASAADIPDCTLQREREPGLGPEHQAMGRPSALSDPGLRGVT